MMLMLQLKLLHKPGDTTPHMCVCVCLCVSVPLCECLSVSAL